MKINITSPMICIVTLASVFVASQGLALADFNYGGGSSSGGGSYFIDDSNQRVEQERRDQQKRDQDKKDQETRDQEAKNKGRVLGASAFNFQKNLTKGHRGNDVIELQKMLIAEGHLDASVAGYLGYFGSMTQTSLAKWQAKNGLPSTGYFGPMSRALLQKKLGQ